MMTDRPASSRLRLRFVLGAIWALVFAAPAAEGGPLQAFRDCAACPEMVVVPTRPSLAIGRFEVTQAEWAAVTGERPAEFAGEDLPVETVSFRDAQRFVGLLAAKTGRPYRLPTGEEWEYAARAGSTTRYAFGDDTAALGAHAWFIENAAETTHPVGSKLPNAFGLHDMHGNVWEWTTDCEERKRSPHIRDCHRRYRGGSFANKAPSLAIMHIQAGGVGDRYFALGLRVVLSLDPPAGGAPSGAAGTSVRP